MTSDDSKDGVSADDDVQIIAELVDELGERPDTASGQLGGLRERFGLVDGNVNTVQDDGFGHTTLWTLKGLVEAIMFVRPNPDPRRWLWHWRSPWHRRRRD